MADNYWLGTAGDFAWTNTTNWSLGAVPTTADNAFITNVKGGTYKINGASVTAPANVYVDEEYTQIIGTNGTPLTFTGGTISRLDYRGTGDTYINLNSGGTNAATCTEVVVRTVSMRENAFNLDSGASGSDYTDVRVLSGRVTLQGGVFAPNVHVGYVTSPMADVYVSIQDNADVDNLYMVGGRVYASESIDTLAIVAGGYLEFDDGNLVTVHQTGGTIVFNTDGGTLTTLNVLGGLFDISQNSTAKTITTASVYSGGHLDFGQNAAVNNTAVIYVMGTGQFSHNGSYTHKRY